MKNRLEKYRYYELKYHCLQYSNWKKCAEGILAKTVLGLDPTGEKAAERELYLTWIREIDEALDQWREPVRGMLYKAITQGIPYEAMDAAVSEDAFYRMYRSFFWHLDCSLRKHTPL